MRYRIHALSGLAALTVAAPAAARQNPQQQDAVPEVRTAASAQRTVRPDLATLTLSFTANGDTPLAAGRALAARTDSLRRALGSLGIPADSLINASRWYWWRGRMEVVPGQHCVPLPQPPRYGPACQTVYDTTYRAHERIEVRIHDMDRVGAVIDSALAHRITDISSVQFSATDTHEAEEEALKEATVRARQQAEAIAAASGGELGKTLSLSTQRTGGNFDYISLRGVTVTGTAAGEAGTVIRSRSIPVTVTVYGRWELVSKH